MNKAFIWAVVIVAGVLFGWFYFKGTLPMMGSTAKPAVLPKDALVPPTDGSNPVITDEAVGAGGTKGGVQETFMFTYTDAGFSPKQLTVKKGDTVSFINQSSGAMWVASAVHPTHQVLPGFDQKKSVAKGGTYVYTFEKVGTWQFHNHMSPEMTGSVAVK